MNATIPSDAELLNTMLRSSHVCAPKRQRPVIESPPHIDIESNSLRDLRDGVSSGAGFPSASYRSEIYVQ